MSVKKKSLPYANTTIPVEDTIANIKKLLKSHGIKDIQETTLGGKSVLRFMYHTESKDVTFEIRPPPLTAPKKQYNPKTGRYDTVNFPMEMQAWRLVYWYLEAKLKAIEYGLISLEREFLNQMLASNDKTVGDYLMEQLERDKGMLKLESPATTSEKPTRIEAQYEVKE